MKTEKRSELRGGLYYHQAQSDDVHGPAKLQEEEKKKKET